MTPIEIEGLLTRLESDPDADALSRLVLEALPETSIPNFFSIGTVSQSRQGR